MDNQETRGVVGPPPVDKERPRVIGFSLTGGRKNNEDAFFTSGGQFYLPLPDAVGSNLTADPPSSDQGGPKKDLRSRVDRASGYLNELVERGVIDGLLIVADGMGGHSSGEVASSVAILGILEGVCGALRNGSNTNIIQTLQQAVLRADRLIAGLNRINKGSMGTTVTVFLERGGVGYFASVGDSRLYVLDSDGVMKLVTADDTLVWRRLENGYRDFSGFLNDPQKNLLGYSLGGKDRLEPTHIQLGLIGLNNVKKVYLATDGAWENIVVDEDLKQFLEEANTCLGRMTMTSNLSNLNNQTLKRMVATSRREFIQNVFGEIFRRMVDKRGDGPYEWKKGSSDNVTLVTFAR
jgi:protein phosphatase